MFSKKCCIGDVTRLRNQVENIPFLYEKSVNRLMLMELLAVFILIVTLFFLGKEASSR